MKRVKFYKTTIFNTWIISWFFRVITNIFLWIKGWEIVGEIPRQKRCVVISIPHISNWDFLVMLGTVFYCRRNIYWLGKKSLFRFPFKWLLHRCGGIEVDRNTKNNLVQQTIEMVRQYELMLTIAPEGTRYKVKKWKTGFYYIAHGSNSPIILCFIDYEKKQSGIIGVFMPTGDVDGDLAKIKEIYAKFFGRDPFLIGKAKT